MASEDRRWHLGVALAVVFVAVAPYLLAWWLAGEGWVFSGLLYNPRDGYTYLAKMREGWMGAWRFTLPYTAHPGRGAYLYLFHLALGHLARWTGLSLLFTYHLARVLGALVLAWALGRFFAAVFPSRPDVRRFAWLVALFGLGMGWLVLPWALRTSSLPIDFGVTEAYPFLTILTNAHFPWALALMLWLLTPMEGTWLHGVAALMLALLSPFGILLSGLILAVQFAWAYTTTMPASTAWWDIRRFSPAVRHPLTRGLWVALGGLPYTAYAYWSLHHDPVLAGWAAQNQTPLPSVWHLISGLLPWLAIAPLGLWKHAGDERVRLLGIWAALSVGIALLPLALQNRFLIGVYIPLVGLAMLSLRHRRTLRLVMVSLALPSALLMGIGYPLHMAATHEGLIYLTTDEAQAMTWLREHTPPESIVLAAPQTGLLIPAFTGRRVLYGHPMETVEAPRYRELTGDFFRRCFHGQQAWNFLHREGVDYIFLGPRERALGGLPIYLPPESVVARFGEVVIYRVP